ncbi:trypsin-like peptidase domain-containing protein [Rapidithrix thailandica]|uniref:Trypsin-like peptidase domain-containing protein n=1 Tax=Rapidithrix thailandica TaxID=413964 RepID=A0AAW9SI78_9BACT
MKNLLLKILLLTTFTYFLQACSNGDNNQPNPSPLPGSKVQVAKIEEIIDGEDQVLKNLLNKVRGSVGKRGPGSKTIWSRKNDYDLGLYISANHVISINSWLSKNAEYFDITSEDMGIFETSKIPPVNGQVELENLWVADFPLMHFDISTSVTNSTILPAEDFYIGIVDNQRVEPGSLPQWPKPVDTGTPLKMYDPDNRTKAGQTWNTPNVGENAIALGYPQDVTNFPNGAVSYGKILSDEEAAVKITELQAAGDIEGDIPYNPHVEFFLDAQGVAGMSGGGVFNLEGQLLGIMVRASDAEKAPKIIRVVKVTYIKSKMLGYYNGLSQTGQEKLRPFISGEL